MTTQYILVPGDGIGPEVVGEAKRVMEWADAIAGVNDRALIGGSACDAVGISYLAEMLENKDAITTCEAKLKAERPRMVG